MKKYRLLLKSKGLHINSILIEMENAPCAQEIFEIFKNDITNKTIKIISGTFKENMNNFTFEAYELPENFNMGS